LQHNSHSISLMRTFHILPSLSPSFLSYFWTENKKTEHRTEEKRMRTQIRTPSIRSLKSGSISFGNWISTFNTFLTVSFNCELANGD
jgi:hypothetical protein